MDMGQLQGGVSRLVEGVCNRRVSCCQGSILRRKVSYNIRVDFLNMASERGWHCPLVGEQQRAARDSGESGHHTEEEEEEEEKEGILTKSLEREGGKQGGSPLLIQLVRLPGRRHHHFAAWPGAA